MEDNLRTFAAEVTPVAREVGMEGKLGAQAGAPGVAGAGKWKDLTDNVNVLATNLTSQVRNFTEATTAVVEGDLSQEIMVEAAGEVLGLESTVNNMMDFLNRLTDEVSRVAQVAGVEGKLSERRAD